MDENKGYKATKNNLKDFELELNIKNPIEFAEIKVKTSQGSNPNANPEATQIDVEGSDAANDNYEPESGDGNRYTDVSSSTNQSNMSADDIEKFNEMQRFNEAEEEKYNEWRRELYEQQKEYNESLQNQNGEADNDGETEEGESGKPEGEEPDSLDSDSTEGSKNESETPGDGDKEESKQEGNEKPEENSETGSEKPEESKDTKDEHGEESKSEEKEDEGYKANKDTGPKEETPKDENSGVKKKPEGRETGDKANKKDNAKDRIDKVRRNANNNGAKSGSGDKGGAGKGTAGDGGTGANGDKGAAGGTSDGKGNPNSAGGDKEGNSGDKKPDDKKGDDKKLSPKEALQKKLEEEKKKIIANGKKAIAAGQFSNPDALKYAALDRRGYLKNVAAKKAADFFKNVVLNAMKTYPFPFIIAGVVLVVILIALLIIAMLTLSAVPGPVHNKYDYTYVKVRFHSNAESEDVSIHEAALGDAYHAFFLDMKIADKGYSDAQLQKIFAAYYLFTKTTILKSRSDKDMIYDVNKKDYDYIVYGDSLSGEWPTQCDAIEGCNKNFWGRYVKCKSGDENAKCDNKGLMGFDEGTKEDHVAGILFEVGNELYDYIAAPWGLNQAVSRIDGSFGVNNSSRSMRDKIIDLVTDESTKSCFGSLHDSNDQIDRNVLNKLLSMVQSGNNGSCGSSSNSVKAYNIQDYIIDDETAYIDIGFWWPVGSSTLIDSANKQIGSIDYGEPAFYGISSPFGYRINEAGERVYHSGIDIPTGGVEDVYAVVAVADGTVFSYQCQPYDGYCGYDQTSTKYGNGGCQIKLKHANNMYTEYLHLSEQSYKEFTRHYRVDDEVKQGTIIARIGSTGCSTGAHLHFMIRDAQQNVINPLNYVSELNSRAGLEEMIEDLKNNEEKE